MDRGFLDGGGSQHEHKADYAHPASTFALAPDPRGRCGEIAAGLIFLSLSLRSSFELVNFFGFFAPARIPEPVLKRLNAAAVQALKTPEMANKLQASGFEPSPTTPDQFREFIRNESAKFAKIIVDANIKLAQ